VETLKLWVKADNGGGSMNTTNAHDASNINPPASSHAARFTPAFIHGMKAVLDVKWTYGNENLSMLREKARRKAEEGASRQKIKPIQINSERREVMEIKNLCRVVLRSKQGVEFHYRGIYIFIHDDRSGKETTSVDVNFCGSTCRDTSPHFLMTDFVALIMALGGEVIAVNVNRIDVAVDCINVPIQEFTDRINRNCIISRLESTGHFKGSPREINAISYGKKLQIAFYDKLEELQQRPEWKRQLEREHWKTKPENLTRIEVRFNDRQTIKAYEINTFKDMTERLIPALDIILRKKFYLTEKPVDKKNKHQSRAVMWETWKDVIKSFTALDFKYKEPFPDQKSLELLKIQQCSSARGLLSKLGASHGLEAYSPEAILFGMLELLVHELGEKRAPFVDSFDPDAGPNTKNLRTLAEPIESGIGSLIAALNHMASNKKLPVQTRWDLIRIKGRVKRGGNKSA